MEKEILYENKKIFYRSVGIGKPVMLVHGFGEDGNVWHNQIEFLKNKFHLIIPDLPGSGKSEMINDTSMEGMAEVLHAIIHEECYDKPEYKRNLQTSGDSGLMASPIGGGREGACIVIGHSMGGYITLALVEHYWNHVNAFGLFHSSAFPDSEEKKETRKKGIEFINKHGAFEFLKTSTQNLFSPNTKSQSRSLSGPNLVNDFISTLANFSADALVAYYHAMMKRPDRTDVLKNTENFVLFVAGEYDNAVPLNDILKQCHLPEKSYIHILKKSGHMGMLEEPEKANQILEDFLNEN